MKRLIFRLSSLGDVILSQTVLEPPYSGETHWVVAKDFEPLIAGSPAIHRIWTFDKQQGRSLSHWIRFLRELRSEGYTEILDAHATLRTWVARIYFKAVLPTTRWKTISKERTRRLGYILFKKNWPRGWRPTHLSKKCALLAGGYGNERPNLRWMLKGNVPKAVNGMDGNLTGGPVVAIVPGSAWPGKEWPTEKYVEWIDGFGSRFAGAQFLLMGSDRDRAAHKLKSLLENRGTVFVDGIGQWSLKQVACALAECDFTLGGDTGLLHLSEAVGTPVISLYGPTRSDFGFGIQDERSISIEPQIWCSPCSKDGTLCFRTTRRFACLREMDSKLVLGKSEKVGGLG